MAKEKTLKNLTNKERLRIVGEIGAMAARKYLQHLKHGTPMELTDDDRAYLINLLHKEGVEGSKIKVGAFLLEQLFGGDIKEALSKKPNKNKSFAKFADRSDLDVSASTLSRWVQAAALLKECQTRKIPKVDNLTVSQLATIAKLTNPKNRILLADKAASVNMNVREIAGEVKKLQPPTADKKKKKEKVTKTNVNVARVKSYLAKPEEALSDKRFLDILRDPKVFTSKFSPAEQKEILDILKKASEPLRKRLKEIEKERKPVDTAMFNLTQLLSDVREIVFK